MGHRKKHQQLKHKKKHSSKLKLSKPAPAMQQCQLNAWSQLDRTISLSCKHSIPVIFLNAYVQTKVEHSELTTPIEAEFHFTHGEQQQDNCKGDDTKLSDLDQLLFEFQQQHLESLLSSLRLPQHISWNQVLQINGTVAFARTVDSPKDMLCCVAAAVHVELHGGNIHTFSPIPNTRIQWHTVQLDSPFIEVPFTVTRNSGSRVTSLGNPNYCDGSNYPDLKTKVMEHFNRVYATAHTHTLEMMHLGIKCPVVECQTIIPDEIIARLRPDIVAQYLIAHASHRDALASSRHKCITNGCDNTVEYTVPYTASPLHQEYHCQKCQRTFCTHCRISPYHPGLTCKVVHKNAHVEAVAVATAVLKDAQRQMTEDMAMKAKYEREEAEKRRQEEKAVEERRRLERKVKEDEDTRKRKAEKMRKGEEQERRKQDTADKLAAVLEKSRNKKNTTRSEDEEEKVSLWEQRQQQTDGVQPESGVNQSRNMRESDSMSQLQLDSTQTWHDEADYDSNKQIHGNSHSHTNDNKKHHAQPPECKSNCTFTDDEATQRDHCLLESHDLAARLQASEFGLQQLHQEARSRQLVGVLVDLHGRRSESRHPIRANIIKRFWLWIWGIFQ